MKAGRCRSPLGAWHAAVSLRGGCQWLGPGESVTDPHSLQPLGGPVDSRQVQAGSGRAGRSSGSNRSPRSAMRAPIVRMVNPSGRRVGSSSSSQSIGRRHRRAGGRARAVRRDERLVDRVLRVVEPGQAAAVVDLPLPADQLGHDRADRARQLLDPGARLVEGRPAAIGTQIWMPRRPVTFGRPARRGARTRCGAAGPAPAGRPSSCARPGRGRSARTSGWCGASTRDVHACHSSAPKLAAHTSAAGSSTTR